MYDEHPVGFVIFTADWRVLALVTASERADDETARALFDRMMAYSGRYRLRVDGCFITIVDSAWYPAWIGTEQTNFFTLDGDTLSIISTPEVGSSRMRINSMRSTSACALLMADSAWPSQKLPAQPPVSGPQVRLPD